MKIVKSLDPATVTIGFASPAFAGPWGRGYGGWGWSPGVCPFFGWLPAGWSGLILSLVFWVLVIAGVVFLISRIVGSRDKGKFREAIIQAYDSLVTRYVRGEITREQFELAKREILI